MKLTEDQIDDIANEITGRIASRVPLVKAAAKVTGLTPPVDEIERQLEDADIVFECVECGIWTAREYESEHDSEMYEDCGREVYERDAEDEDSE